MKKAFDRASERRTVKFTELRTISISRIEPFLSKDISEWLLRVDEDESDKREREER